MRSSLDACRRILEDILAVVASYAFTQRDLFSINLAVEEALVNAVLHGNSGDPSRKVKVVFAVARTEFRVRITDEGYGFDPSTVPDPTSTRRLGTAHGRGLMLMRSFMTGVRHNSRGNSVEMWLLRADCSGAAPSSIEERKLRCSN
jgi:serine/threonine-protein kinase RsbW